MSKFNDDDHEFLQLENYAAQGNLSQVKALVENSLSPKSLIESLQSTLQHAIRGGYTSVASYLFAHSARFTSDMSQCALAAENPEAIFQLALDNGWDITAGKFRATRIDVYNIRTPHRVTDNRAAVPSYKHSLCVWSSASWPMALIRAYEVAVLAFLAHTCLK